MKKILLSLLIFLLIAGCTPNNNHNNITNKTEETIQTEKIDKEINKETADDIFGKIVNDDNGFPESFKNFKDYKSIDGMMSAIVDSDLQPINYYESTRQYADIEDDGTCFGLVVIKFNKDELYNEGQELFNKAFFEDYKEGYIKAQEENYLNEPEYAKVVQPYMDNTAYYKDDKTFIMIYSNNGYDILKKYYPEAKLFFK